jgi:hypothetical protein
MTVYSINKRAFEQANMTSAQGAKSQTAADAFAAALQGAGGRYSVTATMPNAETAMQAHFDKPVEDSRPAKAPERAERPQPKEAPRQSQREKPQAAAKVERPEAKPKEEAQTETDAAPVEARPAETATEDRPAEIQDETAAAIQTAAVDTAEAQVVAVAVQPQQQIEIVTETVAVAGTGAQDIHSDETGPRLDQIVQKTSDDDAAAALTAATDGDGEEFAALAAAAKSAKVKTDESQQVEQNLDIADDQAGELADLLAGTGARVAVQVKTADTTVTTETTAGLDLLMAQDVALSFDPLAAGQGNPAGQGQNGAADQGTANAAQQVAGNPALDNAMLTRAAEAKPFAAALAAQMEAGPQTQAGAAQAPQAVAGLNGPAGTQAASKAQAPQAPQAPRQPQHLLQQQVMDQVSVQITKQAKDGVDSIKIQLKPVELGAIEVKLDVGQDGRVSGVVTADNKDTLAILQKDSRGLEKALEDAGYKADAGSLTFNLREGTQQNAQEGQGRGRGRRGAATGLDLTAGTAATQAQPRWSGGRSGVDIQV